MIKCSGFQPSHGSLLLRPVFSTMVGVSLIFAQKETCQGGGPVLGLVIPSEL